MAKAAGSIPRKEEAAELRQQVHGAVLLRVSQPSKVHRLRTPFRWDEIEGEIRDAANFTVHTQQLIEFANVNAAKAQRAEALPIKPDSIKADSFFDITLTFHSSRERNEVYGWLERQCMNSHQGEKP